MICYSPLPQTDYMIQMNAKKPRLCEDVSMGLGDPDIIKDPLLWNYCALTSRLLFIWENPKVLLRNKPFEFPDLTMYREDLEKALGGVKISVLMDDTPQNFNNMVKEYPVSHLSVCQFYGSQEVYRSVVAARTYVWEESQGSELDDTKKAVVYMVKEGK